MPFELAMQKMGQKRVLVFEQAYTRNAEAFFFGGADTVAASIGSSSLCLFCSIFFCVDVTAVESAPPPSMFSPRLKINVCSVRANEMAH